LIYLYKCPVHGEFEVMKRMSESSRIEHCFCGDKAQRVYCSQNIKVGYWDWGNRLKDGTKVEDGLGDNWVKKT